MRAFWEMIHRNIAFLLHILITPILFWACMIFFERYTDYILATDAVLILAAMFFFYQVCFSSKRSGAFLWLLSTTALAVAVNHWYTFDTIVSVVPWFETVSRSLRIFVVSVLTLILLLIYRLLKIVDEDVTDEPWTWTKPYTEESSTSASNSTHPHSGTGTGGADYGGGSETRSKGTSTSSETGTDSAHQSESHDAASYARYARSTYMRNDFFPFLKVLLAFCIFVLAPAALLYLFERHGLDKKALEFDELFTFLLSYGMTLLLIIFAFILVFSILVSIFEYFRNVMKTMRKNAQKDINDNEYPFPPYILSFMLVCVFFYRLRNSDFDKEFHLTLGKLTDVLSVGNYLAEPLAIVIAIALFILLLQLTYTALLMLIKITPQRIYNSIQKEENKWGVIKKMTSIVRMIILDIILGSLESALKFIKFVPDFFESLSGLVLYDEDEDEDKNEDGKSDDEEKEQERGNGKNAEKESEETSQSHTETQHTGSSVVS